MVSRSDVRISSRIQSVADARYFAERRLPKALFQTFEGGSGSDLTARRNVEAFDDVMFRPNGGRCFRQRSLETTVLGHRIATPVLASSVGMLKVGHRDGEAGVAAAVGRAGSITFVSGATSTPIEMIMSRASGPVYYQLYYFGGRDASAAIIERVKQAGVAGLVVTVDAAAPVFTCDRLYPERRELPASASLSDSLRFAPQALAKPAWFVDFVRSGREMSMAMALRPDGTPRSVFEAFPYMYQQTPTWEDIGWIRDRFDAPIVVKGVLTPADARRAVDAGAAAVVVSNHGGNALDGSMPTLRALPSIVDAVGDDTEVLIDSGVRRGTHVVKALALGARGVLVGRAYLYGLLAAGEAGVARIFELFRQEMDDALAYLGVETVQELRAGLVELPRDWLLPAAA
jgi:isopentenyl diphosphate isomerase/L-lactate dehydrogenase-like FMN-dependent dehydrogenase